MVLTERLTELVWPVMRKANLVGVEQTSHHGYMLILTACPKKEVFFRTYFEVFKFMSDAQFQQFNESNKMISFNLKKKRWEKIRLKFGRQTYRIW